MKEKKLNWISVLLQKYIFSEMLPLEARLLNTIYLVGIISTLAIIFFQLFMGSSILAIGIVLFILCFVFLMMLITNRCRIYTVSRWILVIVICDLIMPCAFFLLGGRNSPLLGYFILSMVLISLLNWGKARIISLGIHIAIICFCYYFSSLPFLSFFTGINETSKYPEQIKTIMVVGLCIGLIASFQHQVYRAERDKTATARKDLSLRNILLQVVNRVAEILLVTEPEDIEENSYKAMEILARCIDADRMYIWQNRIINGRTKYELQYEWVSKKDMKKSFALINGSNFIDAIPEWEEVFINGRNINGPISALSRPEQDLLSRFEIRSILVIPLYLNNLLWGFVNFDNCRREQSFPDEEVRILKSGSLIIATSIMRNINKALIETRMKQQELMLSISRSFITREPLESLICDALKKTGEFLNVNRVLMVMTDIRAKENQLYYTWSDNPEWKANLRQSRFNEIINSTFPGTIPDTGYITAICCNDVVNELEGKYQIYCSVDVKSFIWAPIYVDNVLWGLISIETCINFREWNESDVQLAGLVSSAIAGAVGRDQIDNERAEALEQAVKASKAKGDFLSNMSHEIRTPMNAIIGMTTIGKNAPDPGKKDYAFEKINDASAHLLGIINDILDMSKIEANKLELSPINFNFEKMLKKVVNVINFKVDEKKQSLYVKIDPEIPPVLIGDDQRLAQVITNLLSNAAKFTPEKGIIRLDADFIKELEEICTLQIKVSDSGIGMNEEQKSRLFHAFEQAENSTTRKYGGTGLGLTISRRIIKLMGGNIDVESEPGKGSVFSFTTKLGRGIADQTSTLSPEVNWSNVKILAVNNEEEILKFFSSLAVRLGIDCDTAQDAEEALRLIRNRDAYDFYFIDQNMDAFGALNLVRHIRKQQDKKSIIILIAGYEMNDIEEEARDAGVDKFIGKPLFPSSVVDIINESLGEPINTDDESEGTENFEGHRILLVEDIDINREIVIACLEPTYISIDCAENGLEAFDMFSANPDKYDLILMDVQMPELDGYGATRRIRAFEAATDKKGVPIIAMTANVFKEDINKAMAAGMNDHLGKPLDISELMNRLRKYLPVENKSS